MTTITIYHNQTSRFDEYTPGDVLAAVFSWEADDRDCTLCGEDRIGLLQHIFDVLNVGDDPSFGPVHQVAVDYRRAGNRSLSVGDVVQIGEVFSSVGRFGFGAVEAPATASLR